MAQQLGPAVKAATAPHQHAVSTRAGCECITHALQGLCELNSRMTITSIDGVGAYDLCTCSTVPHLSSCGRMISGRRTPPQGEGGEQGDVMVSLLYSVGQQEALQVAQHVGWGAPHGILGRCTQTAWVLHAVQHSLWEEAGIRSTWGKQRCGTRRHSTCHLQCLGEGGSGRESSGPSVAGCRDPRRELPLRTSDFVC